jgi:hypothetical protein
MIDRLKIETIEVLPAEGLGLLDSVEGMVHANVGQKLLKRNIFKSFYRVTKLISSH